MTDERTTAVQNGSRSAKARGREPFWSLLAGHIFGFRRQPRRFQAMLRRMRPRSWTNRLALILIVAAVASGFATYGALNAAPPFGNDPVTVIWLLNIDLIILLFLVSLIARRLVSLWSGRRQGLAGSRLHVRLVFVFSLLAAAPAIIMTIFAAFFLHFGVQSWFSERVHTAVNEAQAVAAAYLEEHTQVIRADVLAMANDLNREASILIANPAAFDKVMRTQSMLRNLSEAVVFDSQGRVIARSGMVYTLALDTVPSFAMARADGGEVAVLTDSDDDRVRALVKLDGFIDSYLYVGRMVDATVLSHLADTKEAVEEYERLESQRADLQVKITLIFVVVALLLLFAAIWFGLIFARQLITPVSSLIAASDRIRAGDLTARVPDFERQDEFDVLARAFNRMTSQIQEQRNELMTANRKLDQRHRFIETVLAGVSSGVIGVDEQGHITLANSSAAALFGSDPASLHGQPIADMLPGLEPLLAQAAQKPGRTTQGEIPYTGTDDIRRSLLVRIVSGMADEEEKGAVLTFDDITELQSAQRKAAWADVARRIAHEIKNPLTPIQLSAERLRRKYMKQITEDQEIFSQCTDTIIHHVGDIGRMVNEFSAFARMPEPVIKPDNLLRHIRDMVTLQQEAHPHLRLRLKAPDDDALPARFDAQQIRQAFTNIIQNAIDSVNARIQKEEDAAENSAPGELLILMTRREDEGDIVMTVSDSGLGFPRNVEMARLTDPYVTHKEKGTGLGLAIVKKIMEDHKGRLVLGAPEWLRTLKGWRDLGGASVSLILPVDRPESSADAPVDDAAVDIVQRQAMS